MNLRLPQAVTTDLEQLALHPAQTDIGALVQELELALLEHEAFPQDVFDRIAVLISDPKFAQLADAWKLAHMVSGCWETLSGAQRSQLRRVLVASIGRYTDWMGTFVVFEILGRRFPDEQMVEQFLRLETFGITEQRLAPHGLETLARSTEDVRTRRQAVSEIERMAQSEVPEVRQEARESLERLGRHTGSGV